MKGEGNIDVAGVRQTSGRGQILQHIQQDREILHDKREKKKMKKTKTNIGKVKLRSKRDQAAREGQEEQGHEEAEGGRLDEEG